MQLLISKLLRTIVGMMPTMYYFILFYDSLVENSAMSLWADLLTCKCPIVKNLNRKSLYLSYS